MANYRYSVAEEALKAYAAAGAEEQSRLLRAFERIREQPESGVDVVSELRGREILGRWFGNWLILYYLDHPIRTVVIVDCQWT